ncbi:hypothetical protein CspeluHIS016_0500610 [Cutaneotrichosporon spelunceum]|uniref:Protein transport protein sec16 n=1 Tax=Cutaneotrichosporon spelunceum TaxID=1672016 RepID=A0AAD3YDK9_9TREE|nr:hypothetical protein CspeluHIS016_0500610 [Cutaneotrichosporon spelunceum]
MSQQPAPADPAGKAAGSVQSGASSSEPAGAGNPPPALGPVTGASKNKKKKKKKKGAASVSATSHSVGGYDAKDIGASTPATSVGETSGAVSDDDPTPDFSPRPFSPPAEASETTQPIKGVPAAESTDGAALFADDCEQVAFLDDTRPDPAPGASADMEPAPADVESAPKNPMMTDLTAAQLPAGVSTFLSSPTNDFDEGTFESTSDLKTSVDTATAAVGRDHAENVKADQATSDKPALAALSEPAEPASQQAAASPTTTHQPWMPSEEKEVTRAFSGEAESLAFEGPTVGDVLDGSTDTVEARAEGVPIPQVPNELGRASELFADEAHTEAFLPDGPPLVTFPSDYPPVATTSQPKSDSGKEASTSTVTVPGGEDHDIAFHTRTADDAVAAQIRWRESKDGSILSSARKEPDASSNLYTDKADAGTFLPQGDDDPTSEPDYPPVGLSSAASYGATAPTAKGPAPVTSARPSEASPGKKAMSALPAMSSSQPHGAGEAESVAPDIPTYTDVAESDVDTEGPRREGEPTPQLPKQQGAASALFADDAETDAFLPDGDDLPTFEPWFPPKPTSAAEEDMFSQSQPSQIPRAQALFTEDEPSAFDIHLSHPDEHVPSTSRALNSTTDTSAAALFADDKEPEFDIGQSSVGDQNKAPARSDPIPGATSDRTVAQPANSSVVGNQSIQNIFSADNTHDWFVDTSVDDTLDIGRADQQQDEPMLDAEELEYDESQVPQGWFNDNGEFQWYTDEERGDVRAAMIADGSLVGKPKAEAADVPDMAFPPEPSKPATEPAASNPYEPATYEPPRATTSVTDSSFSQQLTSAAPTSSFGHPTHPAASTYVPATSAYAPATAPTGPSAYVPASTSPYAPAQPYGAVATAAFDPYAPAASSVAGYGAAAYGNTAPPVPQVPRPAPSEPPKRMKSTAYDPPLRQSKSFVGRPKSAAPPVPTYSTSTASDAPPAPRPGPPKRSETERSAASVLSPHMPSMQSLPEPWIAAEPVTNPYDLQPVTAYEHESSSAAARSLSPPIQAPPRPSTASAAHPPKPTSFDPPLRPTSSRPPSRHASRPAFQPPPVTSPFLPTEAVPPVPAIPSQYAPPPLGDAPPMGSTGTQQQPIVPPPRGPSRGASRSRAASPKFEKFEVPPPVPAIPAAFSHTPCAASPQQARTPPTATHGAPLRTRTPVGALPRVTSPLKNEVFPEPTEPLKRRAISVHEEVDPEGGADVWDESGGAWSQPPPVHSIPKGAMHKDSPASTGSPQLGYESVSLVPETDANEAMRAIGGDPSKTPVARRVENPYAPGASHDPIPSTASSVAQAASLPMATASIGQVTPRPPPQRVPSSPYAPVSVEPARQRAPPNPYASPPAEKHSAFSPLSPKKTPAQLTSPKETASQYMPGSPKKSTLFPSARHESTETSRPRHQHTVSNPYGPSSSHSRDNSVQDPYNPYAPSQPVNPYAPSAASQPRAHSRQSSTAQDMYNPYAPAAPTQPAHSRQSSAQESYSQYAPTSAKTDTYSPATQNTLDMYNPYSPEAQPKRGSFRQYGGNDFNQYAPAVQLPAASRQSTYDPYAPALTTPSSDLYSPGIDIFGQRAVSPQQPNYFQSMGPLDPTYVPQQVLEQRPVSEDPLGRCAPDAHNIPLAVFGFGGVLITKFPGTADDSADAPSYGYASHRGLVTIRPVSEVAEASALSTNSVPFPGPLVLDPATAKGAAGDKKRRDAVLSYLSARSEEIESGLPYLKSNASAKRRDEEAKLVMMRILTAMVEGDGRLFGTPKAAEAIRAALQPPAAVGPLPSINGMGEKRASAAASTQSQLQQLSSLVLAGDKKDAALFAAKSGLWAHALVLSSAVGPDLWRDIVSRFSKAELGHDPMTAGLQSAYSIFGGITPETINDLLTAANITDDPSADRWREVVAGVLFNGKPTDLVCFDDLGARFQRSGLANAAQVCFLLSPNSPFSDMSLTANEKPVKLVDNARDEDGAIFAEIAEYARSLVPTPKGAEAPHAGLPLLMPIKLAQAWRAAELGETEQAKRYCEAIEASARPTKHTRPMIPRHVAASMEDLLERLTGEPSASPAKGLSMRKSNKSLGSWIEGRLTKFIAGEDDQTPAKPDPEPKEGIPVGPFSHFSSISPGPSGGASRAGSHAELDYPPTASSHDSSYQPETSSYQPWAEEDNTTPVADDSELINPMANMSLGPTPVAQDDYKPALKKPAVWDDDDDDLGIGNSSLSRGRTPKAEAPPVEERKEEKKEEKKEKKEEQKTGWFGGWFGSKKKDESGHNYTKANLGNETSMVYDPDQKRWIVKGTKAAPSAPSPPMPPPRAQTASPAAARATPPPGGSAPPSRLSMGAPPRSGPAGPTTGLAPHTGPLSGPPSGPPSGAPSGPPSASSSRGPPRSAPPGASLDDLLSRPPSGRPTSAAAGKKKRAGNKYVDVFKE